MFLIEEALTNCLTPKSVYMAHADLNRRGEKSSLLWTIGSPPSTFPFLLSPSTSLPSASKYTHKTKTSCCNTHSIVPFGYKEMLFNVQVFVNAVNCDPEVPGDRRSSGFRAGQGTCCKRVSSLQSRSLSHRKMQSSQPFSIPPSSAA